MRGEKLWVRGTFPPKPHLVHKHPKPYRQKFPLNLPANHEGLTEAERRTMAIASDLILGKFDWAKHCDLGIVTVVEEEPDLAKLWQKYEDYKRPQVSPNTMERDYRRYRNLIERLPTRDLQEATVIRDWAIANLTPLSAKRLLTNLAACCEWAVDSGLTEKNLFRGMATKIKPPRKSNDELADINPFSREERDLLIQAFEQDKVYSYYAPYVKFLFFTGCRPSEAVALRWKHISDAASSPAERYISFEFTAHETRGRTEFKEGLKSQEQRKFPINPQLKTILEAIRPENPDPEALVFTSRTGKPIDIGDFCNDAWRGCKNRHGRFMPGIVTRLFGERHYRKPYQTRHTFITLCLEAGVEVKDVARLVGNSPETIYRFYAGKKRNLTVPEL